MPLNIVAQMLIRNEVDVIAEVIKEVFRHVDVCVVLDGYSDDGTQDVLGRLESEVAGQGRTLRWYSSPDPDERFADHRRNELLELTAEFEPDWVWAVDADEISHTSIQEAVAAAEAFGANVIDCDSPTFWLTLADIRNGLLLEDERVSVQKRRRWYSWGNRVTCLWKWTPEHYYPQDIPRRTPDLPGLTWREWQIRGPVRPVIKHYPFRSLRQAIKRAEERMARGGRQYFGKYAPEHDWLIDERIARLHYFQGEWERRNNHDAVSAYMGRLGR